MKKLLSVLALGASLAAASPVVAGQLSIYAQNVDDRVDIYYNGAHQASCTWASNPGCSTGVQGEASGTIEVRFKLTNFVYKGLCLTGRCGKFAGDFYIEHDGAIIWSDQVAQRNNDEGVKYDRTITCDLNTNRCR